MGGPMGGGAPIQVEVSGPDLRVLAELSEQVKEVVASVPGTREVKTTLEEGTPEVQLHIDREKAAMLGVSVAQIASTVRTAYQGSVPTRLRLGGEEYDIRVILSAKDRQRLQDLSHLTLVSTRGGLVTLGDVASIEIKAGPTSVQRKEQTRVVTVERGALPTGPGFGQQGCAPTDQEDQRARPVQGRYGRPGFRHDRVL